MQHVEREQMEVDFLIVGGGAAGLSAAIRCAQSALKIGLQDPMIVVIEKGMEIGAHSFSGAVMDPGPLQELFPDFKERGCPIDAICDHDEVRFLTESFAFKLPLTPPPFQNEGNFILSLSKLNRWLAEQAEALGINVFAGFTAVEVLYDNQRVVGVRTGDKGLDKSGQPKANFEPGMILKSKVTLFADGTRGPIFKRVAEHLDLRKGSQPEVFEEGVKEIVQMPAGTVKPGQVIHTAGYPLQESVGGGFIYTIPGDKIIIGLVAFLDTRDPYLDPHRELQKMKAHPWIQKMLEGGKVVAYGGKTLPAGGWYAMPQLYGEGWMVAGDSASMVDVQKLKGIHLAMRAGMLAGETAAEALLAGKTDAEYLAVYKTKIDSSQVKKQLYKVRNFHQALSNGLFSSLPLVALQEITGGRGLVDPMPLHFDAKMTEPALDVWGPDAELAPQNQRPKPDGELFFDKLTSVYMTGTMHDEDSPNHLHLQNPNICRDVCAPKYNSPCNHFCPANVYEMVPAKDPQQAANGKKDLLINYTNCIHCQTCDIKCPFNNIDWNLPEAGGGPQYRET